MSVNNSVLSRVLSLISQVFWRYEDHSLAYTSAVVLDEPPSNFGYLCHPLVEQISKEVNNYFLLHWPFPTEKSRKKFVAAGFSRVTCLYFPLALDDRIHFACRLLTILFLTDVDLLEFMSFDEGSAYNENLISIAKGDKLPDRTIPVEYIFYDLWESMRNHDHHMANDILEPVFTFMRAQVDRTRAKHLSMGEYYVYREKDVGKALLGALMRFSMKLQVTKEDLNNARPADDLCSKHLSIMNDIWSFEKEVLASKTAHEEGGILCNSVQILAEEADISTNAAKRILLRLCREWELRFISVVTQIGGDPKKGNPELRAYMKGLEYQMSGNEQWSKTTHRYLKPE
ncbi:Aristolochene synthase in complex with 12,13 Difluorofarnesyl diphosphate [Pseudovirgaria hyperparasitica]|uniref:Terpene synthase n=1 Tax=Pseudovirgaria hyperparasitica TaxID=470096 RepID=A0A6A6VSE5_9PEZI|nr:Aristolochene synthase in complex with 12,13 Difluorofarnesyl diphosphate [Pseudovirgaria hyperparasitica]KAF2753075.1 Aristolochene synthase in complex with 12,13 Difluorofarnesyl diphosphate [Pseudovirgaria hyperparasitica]